MVSLVVGDVRRKLNTMVEVFVGDRVRPHMWDQSASLSKAVCNVESPSVRVLEVTQNAASSAYNEVWTAEGSKENRSLIKRVKRVGLKTEPCGTPEFSG